MAVINCFRGGVAVFDTQGTLTVSNERLAVVLGPAPVRVAPGRAFADAAGLDLLQAVATMPALPVLFTSVHTGSLDPRIMLLSKPWQRDELAQAWSEPP